MSSRISFSVCSLIAAVSLGAQTADKSAPPHGDDTLHLDQFVVTASPFQRNQADLAQATSVLAGPALAQRQQATIGETLAGLPGVSSTYFGPGASRPIIRGLGGDRIKILENGTGTIDASAVSPDHAVSVEPFLIDRIEVVRGPASLLYGSSAVGGAVNLITHRIETDLPDRAVDGLVDFRVNSAANERAFGGVADITLTSTPQINAVVLHLDGFRRKSDDLEIPGFAESAEIRAHETEEALEAGEPAPDFARDVLPNSAVDSRGGSAGISLVGADSHLGFVYSGFDSLYGVPGHAHDGEEGVRIDLRQRRLDVQGETTRAFGIFSGARFKLASADYEHRELEGDEIGTVFKNRGYDGRVEVLHRDLGGLAGTWGAQASRNELEAVGDEAFLPTTRTRNRALFAFEEFKLGAFTPQFGARFESQTIAVRDGSNRSRDDDALSFSAGTVWNPVEGWVVGLSLTRTVRAPNTQELYADGPHIGTNAYEIGDATLAREKSTGVELNVRRRIGFVTGEISVFANQFSGYIYEQASGQLALEGAGGFEFFAPEDLTHDELHEALTVYNYAATDADFYGAEGELTFHLNDGPQRSLDLRLAADFTRAEDGNGVPLPRIPAARYTVGLDWTQGTWSAGTEYQFTAEQTRVTSGESTSTDYGLWNVYAAWRPSATRQSWELFVRATNLTNEEARPHTSFLKDLVPLPGRNFSTGVRWVF
ncbi:TonB-dependent receptor [Oleiharenicola lentus]|uniref:TonB-dependent receptor n=1 Tax=Oleiharenicola lentus TaxID=2508720 RepID=UPI003F66F253